jgi:hypothetical protein
MEDNEEDIIVAKCSLRGALQESQIGRILPSLESLVKKMNMVVTAGYFLAKYIILQDINCGNTDLASLMTPGLSLSEC